MSDDSGSSPSAVADQPLDLTPTAAAGSAAAATAAAGPESSAPSAPVTHRSEKAPSSVNNSRPASGAHVSAGSAAAAARAIKLAGGDYGHESGVASEASKAAAAQAQADVLRDGGVGAVPSAPGGLMSFGGGPASPGSLMNPGLFGMGPPPTMGEVALVTVPRLDDLIIKALADNYHVCPAFDWIPGEYLENVVALLQPGKLDFASSAALIQTEKYWQRLASERWDRAGLNLAEHGQSWKRLYCELHLRECLERYHHSKQQHNYKRLLKEVEACKPFVHALVLKELMSHLDLADLLFDFPHLRALDLKFGARELAMDYEKALFGMTLSDALALGKLMTRTQTIHRLTLSENLMNDEAILLLCQGLHPTANATLTYLDLSRNKIGDIGARRLTCLLDGGLSQAQAQQQQDGGGNVSNTASVGPIGSVLTELYLQDNRIGPSGAQAFGAALANNRGLRKLNLSLNSLGDEGGPALLTGLTQHTTLKELNLSACDLGQEAAGSLLELMRFNRSLESLVLTSNDLHSGRSSLSGGGALLEALKANDQIVTLDVRKNGGLSPAVQADLQAILAKRLAEKKQLARKAFQKDWDAAL